MKLCGIIRVKLQTVKAGNRVYKYFITILTPPPLTRMASVRLSPPPSLELELTDSVSPRPSHQPAKVLNHLLVPAERLYLPSRQPDILTDPALTRLDPPQPPCFPVTMEDDIVRPSELNKVFQDKSIFPPEDLIINITPEELSCDLTSYYSVYKRFITTKS